MLVIDSGGRLMVSGGAVGGLVGGGGAAAAPCLPAVSELVTAGTTAHRLLLVGSRVESGAAKKQGALPLEWTEERMDRLGDRRLEQRAA